MFQQFTLNPLVRENKDFVFLDLHYVLKLIRLYPLAFEDLDSSFFFLNGKQIPECIFQELVLPKMETQDGTSTFQSSRFAEDYNTFLEKERNGFHLALSILNRELEKELESFQLTNSLLYNKAQSTLLRLGLDTKYVELLILCTILSETSTLERLFSNPPFQENQEEFLRKLTGLSRSSLSSALQSNSRFVNYGIFENGHSFRSGLSASITESFKSFLLDETIDTFGSKYYSIDKSASFLIETFYLPLGETKRLSNLLKKPGSAKILFYGIPGAGKTEYAKSLAASLGLDLYKVESLELITNRERRAGLVLAEMSSRNTEAIVLLDEADSILNEGNSDFGMNTEANNIPEKKIWLNEFLDECKGKVIFITNRIESIHDSVRRRFDYSMRFFPPDLKQKKYYWKQILSREGLGDIFSEQDTNRLAEKYPFGVGGITTAVKTSQKMHDPENSSLDFLNLLEEVLKKQLDLMEFAPIPNLENQGPYDPTILNTDFEIESLLTLVSEFLRYRESKVKSQNHSLCILFHGIPGTGKTEFAKYLAKSLERPFLQKRASELLGPLVGQSERLIADLFREAEASQSIVFLDEADTFFRQRESFRNSWEISLTNEILTRMETFQGVFIAATNQLKHIDSAAIRRFSWKGEFKPLRKSDKPKLFFHFFPFFKASFPKHALEAIEELPLLTPGDFRSVWNRLKFLDPNSLTSDMILEELKKELSYKSEYGKNEIGF